MSAQTESNLLLPSKEEAAILDHQAQMNRLRVEFQKAWPEIEREAKTLDLRLAGKYRSFLMHLCWKAFCAAKGQQ